MKKGKSSWRWYCLNWLASLFIKWGEGEMAGRIFFYAF